MSNDPVHVAVRRVSGISHCELEAMYALHSNYFANTSSEIFIRDFRQKQWCIVISDADGAIAGYSTIQLLFPHWTATPTSVLFSGDTLVRRECRTANPLLPAFVKFTEFLEQRYPDHVRYWLLITKGYRTYRLLPVNYRIFYPDTQTTVPPNIRSFMERMCVEKFGDRYDPAAGLIRANANDDYLRSEHATIPENRNENAHVRFFLRTNPGYIHGDQLVCLTPIALANLHPSARRRYLNGRNISIEE